MLLDLLNRRRRGYIDWLSVDYEGLRNEFYDQTRDLFESNPDENYSKREVYQNLEIDDLVLREFVDESIDTLLEEGKIEPEIDCKTYSIGGHDLFTINRFTYTRN